MSYQKKLLGITLPHESKNSILEYIKKNIGTTQGFFHIVSLNPEIMVLADHYPEYKQVVETGQVKIVDGVGVVLAAQLFYHTSLMRIQGSDLFVELLGLAKKRSLRVLFIGGKPGLAEEISKCYSTKFPDSEFIGLEGIADMQNIKREEEDAIFSIVRTRRPHFVFAAFGSPNQEMWFWTNRKSLEGCICMGVGGGFDFLSGRVRRAPVIMRRLGLEWLFRLIREPWRWRRQLRLFVFLWLVVKERFSSSET
ncbi:WecB/TagA/CpsF family glycosyltransferase [Candidatus Roizmanbacteria bacterium]|nr:WecB/TagA/CpsF family glycosyltransferase [Candidatus Roizmanbacteria bacterium]